MGTGTNAGLHLEIGFYLCNLVYKVQESHRGDKQLYHRVRSGWDSWCCAVQGQELDYNDPFWPLLTQDMILFYDSRCCRGFWETTALFA